SQATAMDGYLRVPRSAQQRNRIMTRLSHSGPIEVKTVARTESQNIRLYAFSGATVIFNWELNPAELRVHRPDGTDRLDRGSIGVALVRPLVPNTWYSLRWVITRHGMMVFVDEQLVFQETRTYDLTVGRPVGLYTSNSAVDVKSFTVRSLPELPTALVDWPG